MHNMDDRITFRAGSNRKHAIKDLEKQGLIKPGYLSEFCRTQVDELIQHLYSGNGHHLSDGTKGDILEYIEKMKKMDEMNKLLKAKDEEYFEMIHKSYSLYEKIINGLLADENPTQARKFLCEAIFTTYDDKRGVHQRYVEQFLQSKYNELKVSGKLEEIVAERKPWMNRDEE